jgi:catechol 2,3-dioxygenase-like lactoylglutathione lyase family enzyme
MATHIDHVVLWVEDAHRALHFYANVVGLPPVRAEEFSAGTAPFPSVRVSEVSILDLLPAASVPAAVTMTGETRKTAAGKPINHVCIAMDRSEMDALAGRLAAAGVAMHHVGDQSYGARGWSRHWFYFQDLDGNVIEARCYEPQDG